MGWVGVTPEMSHSSHGCYMHHLAEQSVLLSTAFWTLLRWDDRECLCRVTVTLGGCLMAAMAITRSILPRSLRFLANHSSPELFQLTVLAFCLVSAWISGYLVSTCMPQMLLVA